MMLQPPGSSRGGGGKAYASKSRKAPESHTDQLRNLSKLPENKKCADCGARMPQCINLSVHTFVCMSCSGVHREINLKVKSLGHSTFTDEEVDAMKATDNVRVNAVWLARYDPQRDRMKPPQGDQDMGALKAWIKRKYEDKAWHADGGGDGERGGRSSRPPAQKHSPKARRGQGTLRPTVVELPPEKPPAPVDLFADFGAAPAAAAPAAQDGWDAFGGPSQQKPPSGNDDFADFGGSSRGGHNNNNNTADPFASPQPPPPQQQNFANFGGGGGGGGDPFAQTAPPPAQLPQQNFANFGGPAPTPVQPSHDPFGQQHAAPPQSNQAGFAAFGQQQPTQQQFQQPPQMSAGGGFANLEHHSAPSQPPPHSQQQGGGFADFNQPQQQQMQMQMPPQQPQQGFANFGQQQPPQQQPQGVPAPPQQQFGFENFDGMPPQPSQPPPEEPQDPFGDIQPSQQQQQQYAYQQQHLPHPMMAQSQVSQMHPYQTQMQQQPHPPAPQQEDDPFADMVANQQPPAPAAAAPQQQHMQQQPDDPFASMQQTTRGMPHQQPTQQPPPPMETSVSSVASVGGNVKTEGGPMDAFNHLSVSGNNSNVNGAGPSSAVGVTTQQPQIPKYGTDQMVCYKANGDRMKARIVEVHLDGALEPYYTILLPSGKEWQADGGHLEPLDPTLERIESKLLSLSLVQLKQVEAYLSNMSLHVGAAPPNPMKTVATDTTTAPQMEEPNKDEIPATVDPPSPSGMSHVSQLTQPPATMTTQMQMPSLSTHVGGGTLPTSVGGMMGGTMNGFASGALDTIPSPHPAEKAPVLDTQTSARATGDNFGNSGMNRGGGVQQMHPTSSSMGMQQQQQQHPPQNGTSLAPNNYAMANNESFIPSPPGKAPSSGQEQMGIAGQISAPPFGQQQQQPPPPQMKQMYNGQMPPSQMQGQPANSQMLPPQMYGQQMNVHMPTPQHMMQGGMNSQMGPPQSHSNKMPSAPQMNGQMMMNPQMVPPHNNMVMPGQLMGGQAQQQQPSLPQQMAQIQAPLSPQGNPFDVY